MPTPHHWPAALNTAGLRLPLDVTADGRMLIRWDWLACENQFDGLAQVFAGDWNIAAGAARVELAAIDESEAGIEKIDVGRAGGLVGMGDGLRFVIKIREDKTVGLRLLLQAGGTVGGVGSDVV